MVFKLLLQRLVEMREGRGWIDGSVVTSIFFVFTEESQHPRGSPRLSRTPVPGDVMSSSALHGHKACTRCTDIYVSKTLQHIKKNLNTKRRKTKEKDVSLLVMWSHRKSEAGEVLPYQAVLGS